MESLPAVQSARSFGMTPSSIDGAIRLAKIMSASGLMPKAISTPEAVFVAMQMGAEIGLSPMASVQNIAVINGRPGIYGDAALAVVRASGFLEQFLEWSEGERKTPGWTFYCQIKRKGYPESIGKYTWAEACEAGLDRADPASPWKKWTNRMMQFKARNFAMRDQFADILKGIRTVEENSDAINLESIGESGQYQITSQSQQAEPGELERNEFDMAAEGDYPDEADRIASFLVFLTKDGKVPIDEMKRRALTNWSGFTAAYESWKSKQQSPEAEGEPERAPEPAREEAAKTEDPKAERPAGPPTDEQVWADFRSRFINLRSSGYATFVHQNLDLFKNSPKEIHNEAIKKWVSLYAGQPWPLNEPKPTPKDPAVQAHSSSPQVPQLSYSQQYKDLMTYKEEFPAEYSQSRQELKLAPDTVENCTRIHAHMEGLVEYKIKIAQPYQPPQDAADTSGF